MSCAACAPGHRWAAIVLRLERDRNRLCWGRHAGHDLVRLLPGVPLRLFRDLGHPKPEPSFVDALIAGHIIGVVERGWLEGELVLASLHLLDTELAARVRAAWLKAEQGGGLGRAVGLSVSAEVPRWDFRDSDGGRSERADTVLKLRALDVVTTPAAGGYVLRSLQPTELSTTDAHITALEVSQ